VRTTIVRSPTIHSRSIIPLDAGRCGSFPLLEKFGSSIGLLCLWRADRLEDTKAISVQGTSTELVRAAQYDTALKALDPACASLSARRDPRPQPERDRRDRGAAERAAAAARSIAQQASLLAKPRPAISGLIVTSRRVSKALQTPLKRQAGAPSSGGARDAT